MVHGWMIVTRSSSVSHGLGIVNQIHDDGSRAVGTGVLGKVIGTRELLATLVALKRLLLGMQGAVVALEVLLSPESAGAELADECLAGVLSQGLLATAAVRRSSSRWGTAVRGVGRSVAVLWGPALGGHAAALALL